MHRKNIICLLLVIVTLGVYLPVLRNDFINYDDQDYVTLNHHVTGGFSLNNVLWAFTTGHSTNWHPLTWLSHMLDCQLYGFTPSGHHATNLLFHLLNTILVYWVLRLYTGALWRSALVAGLFAWHPFHVESVAWVSERKDVLSTFFWLLTIGAYWLYVRHPNVKRYVLVLALFILGLLSKPMVVTLPFVLLLLDFWPLNRARELPQNYQQPQDKLVKPVSWKKLVLEKVPLILLSATSSVVTFLVQKAGGAVATLDSMSFSDRFENSLLSYARYLGKTFFPHPLLIPYPRIPEWPPIFVWGAALVLALIVFLAIVRIRKTPYLFTGFFLFLGTLVPVIGLVQVGKQSMADRYTYIPLLGIFIIVAWGAFDLTQRWPAYRKLVVGILGLSLLACLPLTYLQARTWKNPITLFTHTLKESPENQEARLLLGKAFWAAGQPAKSAEQFDLALLKDPEDPEILFAKAVLLTSEQKLDEAMGYLEKVVRYTPKKPEVHLQIGNILLHSGRLDEALISFERVLQIQSDNPIAHRHLGITFARQGKMQQAMVEFEEAARLSPGDAETFYNMALAHSIQGNRAAAVGYYRRALKFRSDYPEALNDLAWILATAPESELRNGNEAVALAERARSLSNDKEIRYLGTLDAALAEAGRFQEACDLAMKVKEMAASKGAKDLIDAAEKRLANYRASQAYHEPGPAASAN